MRASSRHLLSAGVFLFLVEGWVHHGDLSVGKAIYLAKTQALDGRQIVYGDGSIDVKIGFSHRQAVYMRLIWSDSIPTEPQLKLIED